MRHSGDEKRQTERLRILGDLHGEVTVFQPMTIQEVSHAGLQVETGVPLQLNSIHDFNLAFRGRSVLVRGRVIHSTISELDQEVVLYRSGVQFVDTSELASTLIRAFMEEMRASRQLPSATTP